MCLFDLMYCNVLYCTCLHFPCLTLLCRDYTQVVMNYLEGRKAGTKKDLKWADYFDVIIVGGNKPAFLEDDRWVIR